MKILGIVAGPRKTGHTARLVEETLKGAEEAGHETVLYYLSDIEIKPLDEGENGYSYPEDGFTELMPHIESMGALVLGTPIYYDHVSSRPSCSSTGSTITAGATARSTGRNSLTG